MADGDHSGSPGSRGGEESRERPKIPSGKVVPFNSKRLTASYLKRVAEAFELPTIGATDLLCQLIEGKLESEQHIGATDVQVIIQEEQHVEVKLCWWMKVVSFWRQNP